MMDAAPVFPFFVGCGRSGTTLVRAIFDSSRHMAVPPESYFVVTMAHKASSYESPNGLHRDAFFADLFKSKWFMRWELSQRDLSLAFDSAAPATYPDAIRVLFATYSRARRKPRYADKTPSYVRHISLLGRLFPEARFVHIIRDGRDVALSYLSAPFGPKSLEEAALLWKERVEAGRSQGSRLGDGRYLEVRYEDLVDDPEATVREICAFIGLDFSERMLRYFERADEVVGGNRHEEAHGNLRLAPTKGLRDWRRDMGRVDVAVFEALAGQLLADLGYEIRNETSLRARLEIGRRRLMLGARRTVVEGRRRGVGLTKRNGFDRDRVGRSR